MTEQIPLIACEHHDGLVGEADPDERGWLVCPWHGYAFDLRSGRSCDGRGLRLEAAPRLVIEAGQAQLFPPASDPTQRAR